MNFKTIAATIALVTAATASAAMADVTFSGRASATFSTGGLVRDHRTPQPVYTQQPYIQYPAQVVVRDHRDYDQRDHWNRDERPYRGDSMVLATMQLGGDKNHNDRQVVDLRRLRGVDALTFAWVAGNTSIKQVLVTYTSGKTELFNVGDALTQGPNNRFSRTIDVQRRPISHITITGYGWGSNPAESTFQVIAKR